MKLNEKEYEFIVDGLHQIILFWKGYLMVNKKNTEPAINKIRDLEDLIKKLSKPVCTCSHAHVSWENECCYCGEKV